MQNCLFNDEEQKIMSDLKGLPEPEAIGILEDSLAEESDPSGQRVLRTLLSKLNRGRKPVSG